MKGVVIINKRPALLGLEDGTRLLPGPNSGPEVEQAYSRLHGTESFKNWLKIGWVRVKLPQPASPFAAVEEEPEAEATEALKGLNVEEAKRAVAGTSDTVLLEEWYAKDSRVTVKRAIQARLSELDQDEEESVEEDEEEIFGGDRDE